MDTTTDQLETYRDAELNRAAEAIALAYAVDPLPEYAPRTAAGRLHYEGWRRRYEISSMERDQAALLPAGTLVRTRSGEYRTSYYYERQNGKGETLRDIWWKRLESDHPGCQYNVLDYPITVLDTP